MPISRLGYVNNGTKKEFPVISALPREMTMAEFALLSDEEKMGDIIVKDYPVNEDSDYVEVVGDGVKTYATLLLELLNSADASKLSRDSKLQSGGDILDCVYWTTLTNEIMFSSVIVNKSTLKAESQTIDVTIGSSASFVWTNGSSSSNLSNTVVPSGTKFILYYNDAHTFDFNTKAENCIFDPTGTSLSSTNAEDAIKEVDGKVEDYKKGNNIGLNGVWSNVGWYGIYFATIPFRNADKATITIVSLDTLNNQTLVSTNATIENQTADYFTIKTETAGVAGAAFALTVNVV